MAIKFEKADAERPQLNLEFNFYKILNSARNVPASIPKLYYFDSVNNEWSALVIELLGPSLKAMYQRCEGFSIATSAQLLMQLTVIMEYVHDCKILYRDVKPDNFLFGFANSPRWCKVHLIGRKRGSDAQSDNPFILLFLPQPRSGLCQTLRQRKQ